jgi:hypothetical protein
MIKGSNPLQSVENTFQKKDPCCRELLMPIAEKIRQKFGRR